MDSCYKEAEDIHEFFPDPWMDRKCKNVAFLSASRECEGFLHICNSDMYSGTVVKADDKILLQLKLCIYCMFKNYTLLLNCVVFYAS